MLRTIGFTLMELMIAIAIVGIIAAIAVPSYLDYTRKAYFTQIIRATAPYKLGVSECYNVTGSLSGCNGGKNGVPANITTRTSGIGSLTVADGSIIVVPAAENGLQPDDTYVLTPNIRNGMLAWETSGGGVTKGYAR